MQERVLGLVSALSESPVVDLRIVDSDLDDVMLTLIERLGDVEWSVPARQLSDGTLRILALLAALLQSPVGRASSSEPDPEGQRTLVIEELENGLHPSQADRVIRVLRDEAAERDVRVLATSHSPALLDALSGDMHRSVIVCYRDRSGSSNLCRLPDLNTYVQVITSGSLGDAATRDLLRSRTEELASPRAALARLFVEI